MFYEITLNVKITVVTMPKLFTKINMLLNFFSMWQDQKVNVWQMLIKPPLLKPPYLAPPPSHPPSPHLILAFHFLYIAMIVKLICCPVKFCISHGVQLVMPHFQMYHYLMNKKEQWIFKVLSNAKLKTKIKRKTMLWSYRFQKHNWITQ